MTSLRSIAAPLLMLGCSTLLHAQGTSPLDRLGIEVKDRSRAFIYTNKESAHFYGETSAPNAPGWMGFTVYGHRFVDDYLLTADGEPLDRSRATVTVYPDYVVRTYPNGIIEQLRVMDTVSMFAVIVTSPKPIELGVIPLCSDARTADAFEIHLSESTASLARRSHLRRTNTEDYPAWLSISGKGFLPRNAALRRQAAFGPVELIARRSRTHMIAFAVADDRAGAERLAQDYMARAASYFNKRRARMERLLAASAVTTGDERYDRALAWAKLSLDALIMNQVTHGLYAGLPWFNSYWGRDTFISLPGAALVTGRLSEARELLRSFAAFQMIDSTSSDYGRIPNIVTTTYRGYNTADGTPRFVLMAKDYIERSGDGKFLLEIYPTVLRSIEGTVRYHTDALGFLTHGDADTWMDAVGPDGPWSPRGNRANDVEALWAQQLEAGVWFATRVGDPVSARLWHDRLERLRANFRIHFVAGGVVADRLRADGTRDLSLRPNQIFTGILLTDSLRAKVLHTVVTHLTYPYGVASLSQDDENFHPYHQYPPYYPKDAAYHNGTVWTWLQGPLISELCSFREQDFAWKLTTNSVHQILDRGAVGTQSELIDAVPRPGDKEPRLSGTCSQAWNLAEFIRNFYDDYLGARVDLLTRTLTVRPHLPAGLDDVHAHLDLGSQSLDLRIERDRELTSLSFDASRLKTPLQGTADLYTPGGRLVTTSFAVEPRSNVRLELNGELVSVTSRGKGNPAATHRLVAVDDLRPLVEPLRFVTPALRPGLAALRGPGYPLLSNALVKQTNPAATTLVDATDPPGDDVGTGHFTYPGNPAFQPGIFDLTGFRVTYDSANVYFTLKFRALADPGWHPEYGFQLTYAAIAIDRDGIRGSGGMVIPHNSGFGLDSGWAYDRLILVGGGLRVENAKGEVLASYMPVDADAAHPLGDASSGIVSFAVPTSYLGKPSPTWRFTVVAGGQDDHGGAGLGEFRTVNREASEWNGGGRAKDSDPNVYDVLTVPGR